MSGPAAPRTERVILGIVSGLAGLLALYFGYQTLVAWTFDGLARGARDLSDTWPLLLFALLGVFGLAALTAWRAGRAWAAPLALAVIGWSLGVVAMAELPDFASAVDLGAGPVLRPFYLVLVLGSGWFAFGGALARGGRRLFDLPMGERALLLFTFWGTANGKLFARETNPGFALLNLAGLLAVALLSAGRGPRELLGVARARLGRWSLWIFAALPLWWFVAAVFASNREPALQLAWRLFVAALVALVAVAPIGSEGAAASARRIFGALVLGLAVVLVAAALGVAEAARFEPLERVLGSRLRVLGLHPNLGAALFAAGLPLVFGWIFAGRRTVGQLALGMRDSAAGLSRGRRALGSLLFAGAVLVLYLADSRASSLGAAVGLVAFGLLFGTRLSQRLGPRLWLGLGAAAALGLVLWLSPLGAELRATLDAKALTQSALGQRWHLWRMAAAALGDHPLTGLGPLGFSGHAQYALPSYYDGTSQTLHTHNIFLAAAEGAGWIGLVLFCLFVGALLALLGRATARAPRGHRDRAIAAATFASVLALFACNQLDLGQSQLTFVPLLFWTAVAIGGLQYGDGHVAAIESHIRTAHPGAPPAEGGDQECAVRMCDSIAATCPSPYCSLLALALLWPAAGATLVGIGRRIDAQVAAFEGHPERAAAIYASLRSPLFMADDVELTRRLAAAARRAKDLDRELALHAALAEALPDSPLAARRYAKALVTAGRYRRGLVAAQRAHALDPFGENAAPTRLFEAWATLGLGQREAGIELLIEALEGGAKLPGAFMAQLDVLLGGADLVARLDQLGVEIVQQAATDQVAARRRLAGLVAAFQALDAPEHTIPVLHGVLSVSPTPIRATYYQLIVQLVALGRDGEAREVLALSPFASEVNFREVFVELGGAGASSSGEALDVFFGAGLLKQRYLELALGHAARGETAAAHTELERALYNASDPTGRVDLVLDYMRSAGGTREERLWQLERYLERASVSKKRARDFGRMAEALQLAAQAPAAASALAKDLGPIRETLRTTLDRAH